MDTVVFLIVLSKKHIEEENYESIKKKRQYLYTIWNKKLTYVIFEKEELNLPGCKNLNTSMFKTIA